MAGRILIADDVATNRIVLKVRLAEAGHQVALAASAEGCRAALAAMPVDLLILDRALPGGDGLAIVRGLRADAATQDLPVIMTVPDADEAACLAALAAGADEVMVKPFSDVWLMARMRALLRLRDGASGAAVDPSGLGSVGLAEAAAPFEAPATVALVSDNPGATRRLQMALERDLRARTVRLSPEEALAARAGPPDVYVIETTEGDGPAGLRLLSELRSHGAGRHAGVCILHPGTADDRAALAFDLGADEVIPSRTSWAEIALRLRRLLQRKKAQDRRRDQIRSGLRMAVIDPLTGLHNRRFADADLNRLLRQAHDRARPLAVMLIDLDRFKRVNDAFGHAAGDAVLVEVARRLKAGLRPGDLLARIGGEEFLAALPDTPLPEAGARALALCRAIEERPIDVGGECTVSVTASIGLAGVDGAPPANPSALAAILALADGALLRSKRLGRNQVSVSQTAA